MINPENVGQLVCGGFQGTTVTPQAFDLIVRYKVSTMILLRKNAQLVDQMSRLIRDLQYIAYNVAGYKYPLLFAVDMEGGMLNSLFDPENLTQFPGAMALAASGDPQLAYEVSKALAIQIRHIGFLIILGPVLDVITKLSHQLVSVRSFGTTIDEVTKYGKAVARGLKDGGLMTVGKHFPGIGNASVDSLLELPMMTDSLEQIRRFNSVPFAELIRDGLLDGISAAGCGVPTISPDETHACLLPVLITQLLRKEIGFDGFVISECLEMDALYDSIGLGQGVMLALCAGCDLVMVCHDFELQVEAIQSISTALCNGMIEEDVILASLNRLETLRKRLPQWDAIFPTGKPFEPVPFRLASPDLWQHHQELSSLAYNKSITLVRDYEGVLPLTQYVGDDEGDNLLILTPLLNPIYPPSKDDKTQKSYYPGEAVFQNFGRMLSEHSANSTGKGFNVLHTTYTANGLTALHESLIEHSKAVVVVTSEASRNMYQIGIVKYISILCGATPSSLSRAQTSSHLAKPLIIIATLSPYDFFYNKSIGSAYLCCYDYTENVLRELVGVLMGDTTPQGCIPGEERFIAPNPRKRRLGSGSDKLPGKIRRFKPPKRKWLVDEFDCQRDWRSLFKLLKTGESTFADSSFRHILQFLHTTSDTQKHFVMRNSSLNIIYGAILTWVQDLGDLDTPDENKTGSIVYIFVDKAKRLQSVGKNLHNRAMRYLIEEKGCRTINLGCLFPLLYVPPSGFEERVMSFLQNSGWDVSEESRLPLANIMVLKELSSWTVPQKIFRELMIVGVRFDICLQTDKLHDLVDRATKVPEDEGQSPHKKPERAPSTATDDAVHYRRWLRELYKEATNPKMKNSPHEAKVIIALEPSNQSVIGSIVLFTNRSRLALMYPMIDEAGLGTKEYQRGALIGGIVGPVIDPSYSNLTEIFKFGLICSGVTYLKSNFCDDSEAGMNSCVMFGVSDDNLSTGAQDIGFEHWKSYYHYLDSQAEDEVALGEQR